jgi:hypothetical protein
VVDRGLERQQSLVLLLPSLAGHHRDRRVAHLVDDASLRVHELGRDLDAAADEVLERVEEVALALRRLLVDVNDAIQVVGQAYPHPQAIECAGRTGDDAHRVALAVDVGVRADAGDGSRTRHVEARRAEVERGAGRGVADDHVHDLTPPGEAGLGREIRGRDRQRRLAGAEIAAESGSAAGAREDALRAGLDLDRPRRPGGQHERRALGRGLQRREPHVAVASGRPHHRAREKRVLVLPVVPVDVRYLRVDRLRREAFAHPSQSHDPALAVRPHGYDRGALGLHQHIAGGVVTIEAAPARP